MEVQDRKYTEIYTRKARETARKYYEEEEREEVE